MIEKGKRGLKSFRWEDVIIDDCLCATYFLLISFFAGVQYSNYWARHLLVCNNRFIDFLLCWCANAQLL